MMARGLRAVPLSRGASQTRTPRAGCLPRHPKAPCLRHVGPGIVRVLERYVQGETLHLGCHLGLCHESEAAFIAGTMRTVKSGGGPTPKQLSLGEQRFTSHSTTVEAKTEWGYTSES